MKLVTRQVFLTYPPGTLFSKYEPYGFGDLCIKGQTCGERDFFVQSIGDAVDYEDTQDFVKILDVAATTGASFALDLHCVSRDGLFEPDENLFAVWEPHDVRALIARLQEALTESMGAEPMTPRKWTITPWWLLYGQILAGMFGLGMGMFIGVHLGCR